MKQNLIARTISVGGGAEQDAGLAGITGEGPRPMPVSSTTAGQWKWRWRCWALWNDPLTSIRCGFVSLAAGSLGGAGIGVSEIEGEVESDPAERWTVE